MAQHSPCGRFTLWLCSLLLTACFLVVGVYAGPRSAALFGRSTTTTSKTSTTRSTTTKVGKTAYKDLLVMEQPDGTYWACNKKTKEKTDYTGIAPTLSNGYWYCKKGKVDKKFTGIGENPFGLWMVVKGKVDLTYDGYWVRNGAQIYRIQGGGVSLYTTIMDEDFVIKDGIYEDGTKEANRIMKQTEPLFQENISKAAAQGVVRTKALSPLKTVLLWLFAVLFFGYLFIRVYRERKEESE